MSVLGTDLGKLSGRQKVRFRASNIGFVFQQYNLLPALSAAENVAVPLLISGWKRRQAVHRARDLLWVVTGEEKVGALPNPRHPRG